MGVGARIKKVLQLQNKTIKQLSESSGVSLNTLYSITKRDSNRVQPDIIEKLSIALGISPAYLIGYEEKIANPERYSDSEKSELLSIAWKLYKERELEDGNSETEDFKIVVKDLESAKLFASQVKSNEELSEFKEQSLQLFQQNIDKMIQQEKQKKSNYVPELQELSQYFGELIQKVRQKRADAKEKIGQIVSNMQETAESYGIDPHRTVESYWKDFSNSVADWEPYKLMAFLNDLASATDEEKRKIWEYARFLLEQRKRQTPPEDK